MLQSETEILAEGVAALEFQGGMDIARDHAIDDALRKAVEQGVGAYINSETQVNNFQLISDNIYSKTSGYVSNYRIVTEEQSGNLYRVIIRAVVKTDNIENDLAAIGILLGEQGRPRIMVVVKELGSMAELSNTGSLMGSLMFETMILDNFRQQGFPVVDAATVASIMERDQLKLILEGDDATATLIGLEAGAEIVIAGTALHTQDSQAIAGSLREIHEYQVSTRAINTRTGTLLAGSAITVTLPFSESQARSQAADTSSSELASAILSSWIQRENTTVIVATNADFDRVQTLRSELRLKLRGVLDVITRDFIGSRATLEILSETSTAQIIDEMTSGELNVNFQVTGMSGNRIDIRFTD
ncbi:MAG: flagellar assembly protein T N-terminal domain-containing protein [Candidatus Sabulitectum sp.]|nr:flagellar assembly protein T N-terminal domain-containing protein [Candidatus Sabulitectum sp.]